MVVVRVDVRLGPVASPEPLLQQELEEDPGSKGYPLPFTEGKGFGSDGLRVLHN